jgi:hypothetical protein
VAKDGSELSDELQAQLCDEAVTAQSFVAQSWTGAPTDLLIALKSLNKITDVDQRLALTFSVFRLLTEAADGKLASRALQARRDRG